MDDSGIWPRSIEIKISDVPKRRNNASVMVSIEPDLSVFTVFFLPSTTKCCCIFTAL